MKYLKVRLFLLLLLSSLAAFVFASVANTQFVIDELVAAGVDIPFMTRIETTLSDLVGMAPRYGAIILCGLLTAFCVAGLLLRYMAWPKKIIFPAAGMVALVCIQLIMHPILGITFIAGARTPWGFAIQCFAGLVGGWVFASGLAWAKKKSIFR